MQAQVLNPHETLKPMLNVGGLTVELKAFTQAFEDWVRDHEEHFGALPAEFEYETDDGESVVLETFSLINFLAEQVSEWYRDLLKNDDGQSQ